jgi:hypothetical protein
MYVCCVVDVDDDFKAEIEARWNIDAIIKRHSRNNSNEISMASVSDIAEISHIWQEKIMASMSADALYMPTEYSTHHTAEETDSSSDSDGIFSPDAPLETTPYVTPGSMILPEL